MLRLAGNVSFNFAVGADHCYPETLVALGLADQTMAVQQIEHLKLPGEYGDVLW